MRVKTKHSSEWAEALALQALAFIAADPEALERFLALTGLGPDQLRSSLTEPAFLIALLDYVLSDEPLLLSFAANIQTRPEDIDKARQILVGPEAGYDL